MPARRVDVVNMSLGSQGACDSAWATAIADARRRHGRGRRQRQRRQQQRRPGDAVLVAGQLRRCHRRQRHDARRNIADYSNTGSAIRVAAPGGDLSASTTGSGVADGAYSVPPRSMLPARASLVRAASRAPRWPRRTWLALSAGLDALRQPRR
ncbi:MAG: hypothetical protein U1F49_16135 [Rubrivivax sp.]